MQWQLKSQSSSFILTWAVLSLPLHIWFKGQKEISAWFIHKIWHHFSGFLLSQTLSFSFFQGKSAPQTLQFFKSERVQSFCQTCMMSLTEAHLQAKDVKRTNNERGGKGPCNTTSFFQVSAVSSTYLVSVAFRCHQEIAYYISLRVYDRYLWTWQCDTSLLSHAQLRNLWFHLRFLDFEPEDTWNAKISLSPFYRWENWVLTGPFGLKLFHSILS